MLMSQEFAIWVILSAGAVGAVVEEVRKRRRVFVLIFTSYAQDSELSLTQPLTMATLSNSLDL